MYLLALLYTILLLLAHDRSKKLSSITDYLGLEGRFNNIAENLTKLSAAIPVSEIRQLLELAKNFDRSELDDFLGKWTESLQKSICFDNYELFARILGGLFQDCGFADDMKRRIRKRDLRYIADKVVAACDLNRDQATILFEEESAGELIRKQLQALQACNITY
jgi:hypothetical protein